MFATTVPHSTGLPLLDAQHDFRRARRSHTRARIGRLLTRRRGRGEPLALAQRTAMRGGAPRLQVVPLRSIVGTLEPTRHFDDRFRPTTELVRHRWERIALAYRRGTALPPVVLRGGPGGYYVVDGRHRVSVAHSLRLGDIDAWVTAG